MSRLRTNTVVRIGIAILVMTLPGCSGFPNPFSPSSTTTSTTTPTTPTTPVFAITAVTLTAESPTGTVACPANVVFSAGVTSNKDGVIAYKWERSDGSTTATQTLTFPSATALTAVNTWSIPVTTSGWQRLHVLTPNDISSTAVTFVVTCR